MKKKIVNTDDNDTLNPMSDVRNYGAGAETGVHIEEVEEDGEEGKVGEEVEEELWPEDKPLPGEIANPEEQEDADEMA